MWSFLSTEVSLPTPVYNMSVNFNNIYGNSNLKDYFSACIESNVLPHAMIFEGDRGSGKYTFAKAIVSTVLCTSFAKPCGSCKNCRQISEGTAPDVYTVELPEDKASISIEHVRNLRADAQSVPCEGDYKFYIIRNSEKMTVQAQNALLKILEEPPRFVVFILLTENASQLLPTIRSRASVFRMQRFDDSELADYFIRNDPKIAKIAESDREAFDRIIKSSSGSIGTAAENMDKRSFALATKEYEMISGLLDALISTHPEAFMQYEDLISTKREELRSFFSLLRVALRDVLSVKKGNRDNLMFFDSSEVPMKISKSLTAKTVIDMISTVNDCLNSNDLNANANLLKINCMCALWNKAHS